MTAFYDCPSLETITLPQSLKSLDYNPFDDMEGVTVRCYKNSPAYKALVEADNAKFVYKCTIEVIS